MPVIINYNGVKNTRSEASVSTHVLQAASILCVFAAKKFTAALPSVHKMLLIHKTLFSFARFH